MNSYSLGHVITDGHRLLKEVIKKISKATKRFLKRFLKWLDEGARIHNRAMTIHDERYMSNPYHIRGLF
jgi:hypothetical protein